tara:strand:- start:3 stop:488 length:486 start_codon:yes stop_codon:yes gene_type:complete
MKIFRIKSSAGIDYIEDFVGPSAEGLPKEKYLQILKDILQAGNDSNVFFLIAFKEGEETVPSAFLLTWAPPDVDHTFILDSWFNDEEISQVTKDEMFFKALTWTDQLERKEIRMTVEGEMNDVMKKWGFKPFSVNVRYPVPAELGAKMMNFLKEYQNGLNR